MEDKKIKVLVLSTSPKRKGGVANYVKLLTQYLDKKKYRINHFTQGKSITKWKNIFLPFIVTYQLLKFKYILRKNKPDIVHFNSGMGKTNLIRDFVFLKASKGVIPVLFFIHGWEEKIFNYFKNSGFAKKFFLKRISMADAIVVLASQFKEDLVNLGITPQKILVSSTMVESEKYYPENKDFEFSFKVLFCANMNRKKGPYEVLDAAPFVVEKYPDTKFIFMGEGVESENLKKMSKDLGLENNIRFTGYVSAEGKIKIFKNSSIFVYPSYHGEGFPTVILEAMAAGMPLVTTPVGGLADALEEGKQGLIIKSMPPNPKEVAEKIVTMIENSTLMKKMSENNLREIKEKYDVRIVCRDIERVYEGIIGEE